MKRQEFKNSLRDIKCSDDFRSRMNEILSAPVPEENNPKDSSSDTHESEVSVINVKESVERKRFLIPVAACAAVFICTFSALHLFRNSNSEIITAENEQVTGAVTTYSTVPEVTAESDKSDELVKQEEKVTVSQAEDTKITEVTRKAFVLSDTSGNNKNPDVSATDKDRTDNLSAVTQHAKDENTGNLSNGNEKTESAEKKPENESSAAEESITDIIKRYRESEIMSAYDAEYNYHFSGRFFAAGTAAGLCDYILNSKTETGGSAAENPQYSIAMSLDTDIRMVMMYINSYDMVTVEYLKRICSGPEEEKTSVSYYVDGITDYARSVFGFEAASGMDKAEINPLCTPSNIMVEGYMLGVNVEDDEELLSEYNKIADEAVITRLGPDYVYDENASRVLTVYDYFYSYRMGDSDYHCYIISVLHDDGTIGVTIWFLDLGINCYRNYSVDESTYNRLIEYNEKLKAKIEESGNY